MADLVMGMHAEQYYYAGGFDDWFLDTDSPLTAEELAERGIRGLPASLDAAVRAMEADAVVMDALGPYAVRYAAGKRREWEEYRTQISQWELDQYLANC